MQVQQAVLLGRPVLTKTRRLLLYAQLVPAAAVEEDSFAQDLLIAQPELQHLERCLRTYLASLSTGSTSTPVNWSQELPHAARSKVSTWIMSMG